jgi:hypothetical protein
MKIFIGGEIESVLSEQFRVARNTVLDELNNIKLDTADINELSFYIFLLKDFETVLRNRYLKRCKRIEIEIFLSFNLFKEADEYQRIKIIQQSIADAICNFQNKNIKQDSISLIKDEINKIFNQRCQIS